MTLFDRNNRKGGLMDEIRCDESSYLIWKWHPSGLQSGTDLSLIHISEPTRPY